MPIAVPSHRGWSKEFQRGLENVSMAGLFLADPWEEFHLIWHVVVLLYMPDGE